MSIKIYSKNNPFLSTIRECTLLSGPTSTKKMYHIVLDAKGFEGAYKVGDSVGILPTNDREEVEAILHRIGAQGGESVLDHRSNTLISIQDFLLHKANLAQANRSFTARLAEHGADPLKLASSHTILELLQYARLTPSDLAATLMPLLPRFYSIANSQTMFPSEFHLLVKYVHYTSGGQERKGVGSHFLVHTAKPYATPIPLYIQPSNHFTLPPDHNASIIMIGPGTGVAPFRAFLQERIASQSSGRNWLFFGERNQASDFYYESFWKELCHQGRLRLDTAFSRDSGEKTYVQHKMYEQRKSLWDWIQSGALVYVCGDANQMAKDVDAMLHRIVKEEGGQTGDYVKAMRKEKRYLVDVY